MLNGKERMKRREKKKNIRHSGLPHDTRAALKKQFSTEIATRVRLFDRFPFSLSLVRLLDRIGTAGMIFTEWKRDKSEREWGRICGALFIINDIHALVNSRDFHSAR